MGSGTAMHTWEAHRRLLLFLATLLGVRSPRLPVVLECKGHLRYTPGMYASGMVLESPSGGELPFTEVRQTFSGCCASSIFPVPFLTGVGSGGGRASPATHGLR
ncbi:hypothetical protein TNCV_2973811 [Trichonephila clavipes]|nr:hypothetical protein TNCV_2973811 [Trichonephila clavipes]